MTVAADPNSLHGFSKPQVEKAASGLLAHLRKNSKGGGGGKGNDLFEDDDELLYMIVSLKKMPQERRNDKPVRIAIPHPIYRFEGAEVCLIVKDAPGANGDGNGSGSNKAAKAKAKNQKLAEAAGVSKVVALSKLKSKYEPHEAKRALANAFDLFLADARVLPSLARLLGKAFFRAKKQPVPVDLRGKDWKTPVSDAVRATYYFRGGGSCVNVRVARSSFTAAQVADNVEAALRNLVPKLSAAGKWSGVRSVLIKSAASAALPVYQSEPRGVEDDDGDEEESEKEVAVVVGEEAAAGKNEVEKKTTKKKKASSALEGAKPKKKKTVAKA